MTDHMEIPETHTRALATYTVFLLDLEDVATIPASHFLQESAESYEGLLPQIAESDRLMFDTIMGIITAHVISALLPPVFAPAFESENPLVQVKGTIRLMQGEEVMSWLKGSLENTVISLVIENSELIDAFAEEISEMTSQFTESDDIASLQELSPDTFVEIYKLSTGAGKKLLQEIPIIITQANPFTTMMLELYSSVAVGVQTSLVLSLKTDGWDEEKELTVSKFTTYMIAYRLSKLFAPHIYHPQDMGTSALNKLVKGNIIRNYADLLRKSVEIMEDMHMSGISWEDMRKDPHIFPEVLRQARDSV